MGDTVGRRVPPGGSDPGARGWVNSRPTLTKEECLDRMIFFGKASLRHAVTEYVEHHYRHERQTRGRTIDCCFRRSARTTRHRRMARSYAGSGSVEC